MSKIAFLFPGQGAQKAGMGADFYENSEIARYIFDQAGEELDLDMKELCFEENDRLDLTDVLWFFLLLWNQYPSL